MSKTKTLFAQSWTHLRTLGGCVEVSIHEAADDQIHTIQEREDLEERDRIVKSQNPIHNHSGERERRGERREGTVSRRLTYKTATSGS